MATTTNFGWTTPDDTALVKDGASAIRTLGSSIDTSLVDLKGGTSGQVLSKNSNSDLDFTWVAQDDSNAIQNALLTTTGDTIYASGASTPARLGIGSTGQVLTVAGGVPTWASASASTPNYTLLNSGGTALTGAATISVNITAYNNLLIFFDGASASANSEVFIQFNGDTGSNFNVIGLRFTSSTAGYRVSPFGNNASTGIIISRQGSDASNTATGSIFVSGAASSGAKVLQYVGGANDSVGSDCRAHVGQGTYNSASTITQVQLRSSSGNFDAGTLYIYGAN